MQNSKRVFKLKTANKWLNPRGDASWIKPRIVCIVGPTAAGKSALGMGLAKCFGGEIISADSRQVYKGLDIGTGKITKREMKGIPHHLLDVVPPKKVFTAHAFVVKTRKAIGEIVARGNMPIIVGGTGFYIDALVGRISLASAPANPKFRATLEHEPTENLLRQLQLLDPERARTIDIHNKRRLIRALEISQGLPLDKQAIQEESLDNPHCDILWIGVALPSDELRARIAKRLSQRLKRGMIAEAKRLHEYGLSYKRMHELGLEYRSLARFLQGEITRQQLEAELQTAIWHYAKRQMTYWRRNKEIRWFAPSQHADIMQTVEEWLR